VSDRHLFSGILLVDPRGWVLLQERDEHPAIDPEKWGLVGGHLDPDEMAGEEFEPAAYRELAEETEVVLPPGRLTYWKEFAVDHTDAYGTVDRMAVFVAAVDLTDDDVVCHEGRRIVFVDPAIVADLPLTKSAEAVLPEFLASEIYARSREVRGSQPGG
jgi:ADP-ribose pyrophosphatase YjhB (NUDIX family)